jgi:Protein of unknown function (DUF1552)
MKATRRSYGSRRDFLRVLGGAATIPLLHSALSDYAFADGPGASSKRILLVFTSCGIPQNGSFWPSGSRSNWSLSPVLQPLSAYKDRMTVVKGLVMQSAKDDSVLANPNIKFNLLDHSTCLYHVLTGTAVSFNGGVKSAGGKSFDVLLGGNFPNSTVANICVGSLCDRKASWTGPGVTSSYFTDPNAALERLFKGFSSSTPPSSSELDYQLAVVNHLRSRVTRLNGQIPVSQKPKIDAHLAAMDRLKTTLQNKASLNPAACTVPQLGSAETQAKDVYNFVTGAREHMNTIAGAFACGITNVALLQYNYDQSWIDFPWLPLQARDQHHLLSHASGTGFNDMQSITTFYAGEIARLCGELASIPEGTRTVLDNTVVVWFNELSNGKDHQVEDMPFVLIGGAGGKLATNTFVDYANKRPHNDLWITLAQALGVKLTTFGDPKQCTGPLEEIMT